MTFLGEYGQSVGDQDVALPLFKAGVGHEEILQTANELAERIAVLDEKIAYGGPSGQRKAQRDRNVLFDQWAAHYPNYLKATPPVDAISPLNDHAEPVTARRARKPTISPVYQFGLATMLAGAAAGAMIVPEVRADEQPPLPQKMTGQIDLHTRVDFIRQKDEGIYATMPMGLKKTGPDPASLAWVRFAATGGDVVNGWVKALEQFKVKITGTLAQCADTIVSSNKASFSDVGKQSSARRMNTDASPVLVSVKSTIMVNGNDEKNYCAVNNPNLLRIQPTKIPSPIKPTQASTDPMGENEKRNNTLFGLAGAISTLGLVSGAFWWIRRRNQMGVGQTSMVQGRHIEYTHKLPNSNPVTKPERLDSPLDAAAANIADSMTVAQIRDLNMTWEGLADYVGDKYAAIKAQLIKSRPTSSPPPAKPPSR